MSRLNDATPEEWNRVASRRGVGDINPRPQVPLGTRSDRNTPFPDAEAKAFGDLIKAHMETKATSKQVAGDHYAQQEIEPIEYTLANDLGYCEGNVVKYVTRHKLKGGKEDILKAMHYLQFILDYDYGDQP